MAAWYDTVADYTAVPFARGALFGGAQFLNWGIGRLNGVVRKLRPRAAFPEEYEAMNARSIEKWKNTLFPYKSAGDGEGNAATTVLEFGSSMVGGGAATKALLKGTVKGAKVVPVVTHAVGRVLPKSEKLLKITTKASRNLDKANADVALSATRLRVVRDAYNPADPNSVEVLRLAEQALQRAKAAQTAASAAVSAPASTAASTAKAPGFWRTVARSVSERGSFGVGERAAAGLNKLGVSGILVDDVLAGGINNFIPGAIGYGVGEQIRSRDEAVAAEARVARDGFYRSLVSGRAGFTTYVKGTDVGSFLRAADAESARVAKLTDKEASKDVPAGLDPSYHRDMMAAYRESYRRLPEDAMSSVRSAYGDDQSGYRKLLEARVDRDIIPAAFPDVFRDGLTYDSRRVWSGDAETGKAVAAFREQMLGNPKFEKNILTYGQEGTNGR